MIIHLLPFSVALRFQIVQQIFTVTGYGKDQDSGTWQRL